MVLNVAMFALARSGRMRPGAVLHLSTLYIVMFALTLSALRHALPWAPGELLRSWSPLAVLLVVYGALVPARPSTVLYTSLFAAATDPLALYLSQSRGERPELVAEPCGRWVFLLRGEERHLPDEDPCG